jgi:hypothetical protein
MTSLASVQQSCTRLVAALLPRQRHQRVQQQLAEAAPTRALVHNNVLHVPCHARAADELALQQQRAAPHQRAGGIICER